MQDPALEGDGPEWSITSAIEGTFLGSVVMDDREYLRFARADLRNTGSPLPRHGLTIGGIALVVAAGLSYLDRTIPREAIDRRVCAILSLIGLFLIFFANSAELVWLLLARMHFRHSGQRNLKNSWCIDSEGLRWTNALCDVRVNWAGISKVVETTGGFMLYSALGVYWLPRSGFLDGGADLFPEFARLRVAQYRVGR